MEKKKVQFWADASAQGQDTKIPVNEELSPPA
jgi:hypothetical protein